MKEATPEQTVEFLMGKTDIVARLRDVGLHLGDAIAGYRDDNLKRAARGAVDIARTTQEAADEIAQLRADVAKLSKMLNNIADRQDFARRVLEKK